MARRPREIKVRYDEGQNVSRLLRDENGDEHNSAEVIEIAYDLQAGSYIEALERQDIRAHQQIRVAEIARVVRSMCTPSSIMEAGVGEATTLSGVLQNLGTETTSYGFDLSWSRVAYANRWLLSNGIASTKLCTGNLLDIPFGENSVDVVYTSHSIEPNGGKEIQILKELFRVARRFLILIEPDYENATPEARSRMEYHGYCRNLIGTAESLGYEVIASHPFPSINPLNPSAITIIRKMQTESPPTHVFACPRFKTALEERGGVLYSPEALAVYPIIQGIPCLRIENAILASKYPDLTPSD